MPDILLKVTGKGHIINFMPVGGSGGRKICLPEFLQT